MNGAENYRRFLAGDEDSLVALIEEYKGGLMLYLTGLVGDIGTAEELTEDTFVKLGIKKPKYLPHKASFKTWLYTIARNVAMDYLRKQKRRAEISLDEMGDLAEVTLLEQTVIRNEDKIVLHRALRQLEREHRQILWLIYFEEFDYQQVSRIIGRSLRGTQGLAYRARKALAKQLEKEGFVYEEL